MMTPIPRKSVASLALVVAVLLVLPAVMPTRGEEPPHPSAKVKAKARRKAAGADKPALPERPARTVSRPTLTPAELDGLIQSAIESERAPVAQLTRDEEFLRRAYLDLTGEPPAPEQVVAFIRDPNPRSKRTKLIDRLLASEDFARTWARYWVDVIRHHATNENKRQVHYDALEDWLAGRFAEDAPWDETAAALIAATGRSDENGAIGLTVAHSGTPVELAGEVARVFLGIQIQCAQCHDHPTDRWKRQQFHELAAFFAGVKVRKAGPAPGQGQGEPMEVVATGRARYTMPDLKDPSRAIPVAPGFFLADGAPALPMNLPAAERRRLVASYVTGQDNPWFARAFVNRIWGALLGEGFYQPVDDLGPDRECRAGEALEALAAQFQAGGYDVKWLFRTILNTRAYQRQVRSTYSEAGRTPFAANCTGRLRSDQIAASLARALDLPAGGRKGLGRAVDDLFAADPSLPIDQVLGTVPQALFLMNSRQVNAALRAGKGTALGAILAAHPRDDLAALTALYLRTLGRGPTAREAEICGRYLRSVRDRREAFEDIAWSLINSTEFLSRR